MAFHALPQSESQEVLEKELFEDFANSYPVLTDWLMQDKTGTWQDYFKGNNPSVQDTELIHKVIKDIEKLEGKARDLKRELTESGKEESQLTKLYLKACERRRKLRLSQLISMETPIVFAQHHNFKMSFIGYTEGLSDARHERFFKPGARLCVLGFEGLYGQVQTLIDDPHGMIRDVDVSADGKHILFAWKKSDRLDDYHIYQYQLASNEIQQLTTGLGRADYEASYLPDGDIIFASTRPEQSVPCWWTEISNLYRMNTEGKYLRRLAIDQVHTLYPQALENGRIIYTRWDYNDRGQNYPHPIFSMNPDGTAQRVYYGGNSWFPTSLLHARAIPGTDKVMAVAAGHHTRQHGKLVVLDVSEGRDEGKGMHFVAPKREVPYERVDVAQQHGDQFRYPYPINSHEFLISYMPDNPQTKENRKYADDAIYGLYWMDLDGNRELLYKDQEISVGRPVPLHKPNRPKVIPDQVDYTQKTGQYYVHDVYEGVGLEGIPRGEAKKIRVVRLNYRASGVGNSRNEGEGGRSLNSNPVAIGNGSWDVKEILGDVDIHEDGSALFEVPAMESIYLQVLDKKGRVIQTTRSWDTVRPGEKKACKGCHAKQDANFYTFGEENTQAWKHGVQQLQPFYGPTRGFSFIKEVQPVFDAKCVSCHNHKNNHLMSLEGSLKSHNTGEKRRWSESYLNLTHVEKMKRGKDEFYLGDPENEVINWISKMSKPTELKPYSYGAATSKMMHMLEEGHHSVSLTEEEYHKLAAWLDLLVPFVGEYREANDWSGEEMAYYNYYEQKRREHHAEEMVHLKEWLAVNEQSSPVAKMDIHSTLNGKGYRRLQAKIQAEKTDRWHIQITEDALSDRIEFAGLEPTEQSKISVVAPEGRAYKGKWQKNSFVLHAPGDIRNLEITYSNEKGFPDRIMVQLWGIAKEELRQFESHQPYLKFASEKK